MRVLADFLKAVAQMGDPAFRGVLLRGIGLTLALLAGLYVLVLWLVNWLLPDSVSLPLIGDVGWIDNVASGASILLMLVLSVFLMVPVASAFTSLFLDDVADAVERRHYPHLPPAPRLGLLAGLRDTAGYLGLLVLGNALALVLYLAFPPAGPFIFLALNGYLLGQEYVQIAAMRRLGRAGARDLRRRHRGQIWLAGVLMAVPLTIPLVNLLIPVLGAATFTHLFHRLQPARSARYSSGRTSPGP